MFERFVGESDDSQWYHEEKERFEQEYDTNKDGVLSREEVRKWISPDMMQSARDEAKHLLSETDTSKDQLLSYDEIVDKYDLWVGSEATNYGKKIEDEL